MRKQVDIYEAKKQWDRLLGQVYCDKTGGDFWSLGSDNLIDTLLDNDSEFWIEVADPWDKWLKASWAYNEERCARYSIAMVTEGNIRLSNGDNYKKEYKDFYVHYTPLDHEFKEIK